MTTVSNAFNNRTGAMRPSTRQRVFDAAEALGFHPSQAARSLVIHQTTTIGLLISEIATPLFFGAVSLIEREARDHGYNVVLSHASTPEEEEGALDLLLGKEVEGIVVLATSEYRQDATLAKVAESVPVVTINRAGEGGPFDRVGWDNVTGLADAVRHLHTLGHRRIAFLRGPVERQSSDERLRGYRLGLSECGLAFREQYIGSGDYTAGQSAWSAAADEILAARPRPTAVIASDDSVAAIVMRRIQDRGLSVPGDVAVLGIDDQPFAALLTPALTTLRLPVPEAGRAAIELVLDRLRGGTKETSRPLLPMPLVVRESTVGQVDGASRTDSIAHDA